MLPEKWNPLSWFHEHQHSGSLQHDLFKKLLARKAQSGRCMLKAVS